MSLGKRLKEAREKAGYSQAALARKAGVSQPVISDIESGEQTETRKLAQLAKALNVTAEWLGSGRGGRTDADANVRPGPAIRGSVPLLSWVQAGPFTLAIDPPDLDECELIPAITPVRARTFALRVENDSMAPDFPPGTILIVEPDTDHKAGDFVIVGNGAAEATFKQLVRDGDDWLLRPMNPQYPMKPMPENGRVIGVVVAATRKLR
ncbi:MAG: hypothetical protein C0434_07935 [Xanthomonadaceae bacterium]|nr:hypothetical protein [Xanthomonadaceae bacterium]